MRKREEKHPLRMLVLITQLGITMMVPIFFCAWLGLMVSRKTGIEILFVVFIFAGALAGFRSCYHIIRRFVPLKGGKGKKGNPEDHPGEVSEDPWIKIDYPGEHPDDPWDR